jgi:hypothetical protein
VLSVIPPMTQLNTPYPSTAYLTGFLRSRGVAAVQEDLALALVLRAARPPACARCAAGGGRLPAKSAARGAAFAAASPATWPPSAPAMAFLQGATARWRTASWAAHFLPEGPRFASLDVYVDDEGGDPLGWAFGALGMQDRAATWPRCT